MQSLLKSQIIICQWLVNALNYFTLNFKLEMDESFFRQRAFIWDIILGGRWGNNIYAEIWNVHTFSDIRNYKHNYKRTEKNINSNYSTQHRNRLYILPSLEKYDPSLAKKLLFSLVVERLHETSTQFESGTFEKPSSCCRCWVLIKHVQDVMPY